MCVCCTGSEDLFRGFILMIIGVVIFTPSGNTVVILYYIIAGHNVHNIYTRLLKLHTYIYLQVSYIHTYGIFTYIMDIILLLGVCVYYIQWSI